MNTSILNPTQQNLKLILFLIVAFAGASCSPQKTAETAVKTEQAKVKVPKTTPIKFDNPAYEITIPAELLPYEQVAVYAKVTGFVKKLLVDRGSQVKKGQLLAVLEAPEMDQKLNSNRSDEQKLHSDYLFAKQTYDRLSEASKTVGAVADIELEKSKSIMESAWAAYQASKSETAGTAQLQRYLHITAPFDGIITDRNVSIGALAGTNSNIPLFTIAQGNQLRLTLSLPEKHAASIYKDMPATFTVSSRPGETFETKLSRSSTLLDKQDRSLKIEFDVANANGQLQGGDYAQVKLQLKRAAATAWVPQKSIITSQAGTFIFTLNSNNEIKKIAIKEGIRRDSLTEIFGQLNKGDMILLQPSEEIKEGKIDEINTIH
ncbi:efflux RND transporter periplasmic adaptor subunit [Sphingobacterium sp. N143]|uniref:efflux RND transporter periplasmic adaptor subunit n=1 Tax=Sphingobacterium sp. N143 TaxID=2746727 RepID=UPI0025769CDD|nr:efflux RND transporter periplasmic adaptor subunit [Sphingobacterium sp. N143]MDM1296264.1 efflux RND transporter periplasmic adaptor subunit [Sphingobacterium sp. N143]